MSATTHALSRRVGLQHALPRLQVDAAVISSYENVSYIAGTHVITQLMVPDRLAFVVVDPDTSTLLVCNIEESQVRSQTDISDVRTYVEFEEDPSVALMKVLRSRGLRTVGIEARRLPAQSVKILEAELDGIRLVPIDRTLDDLQGVKSDTEITILKDGAQKTLTAVDQAIEGAAAGDLERSVSNRIHLNLLASGGDPTFLVFSSGRNTMYGHPEPEDRPLESGTIWRVDLGARWSFGFYSDVARTGIVGEPSSNQETILAQLRQAQQAAIDLAEPGRPARELFNACRDAALSSGLLFGMPHIGHGIGIGLHEQPMLEPRNETRLAAGMLLNIEPMVVLKDRGEAYHTEDLVLVAESGPQLLTKPQDALLRIKA